MKILEFCVTQDYGSDDEADFHPIHFAAMYNDVCGDDHTVEVNKGDDKCVSGDTALPLTMGIAALKKWIGISSVCYSRMYSATVDSCHAKEETGMTIS